MFHLSSGTMMLVFCVRVLSIGVGTKHKVLEELSWSGSICAGNGQTMFQASILLQTGWSRREKTGKELGAGQNPVGEYR